MQATVVSDMMMAQIYKYIANHILMCDADNSIFPEIGSSVNDQNFLDSPEQSDTGDMREDTLNDDPVRRLNLWHALVCYNLIIHNMHIAKGILSGMIIIDVANTIIDIISNNHNCN